MGNRSGTHGGVEIVGKSSRHLGKSTSRSNREPYATTKHESRGRNSFEKCVAPVALGAPSCYFLARMNRHKCYCSRLHRPCIRYTWKVGRKSGSTVQYRNTVYRRVSGIHSRRPSNVDGPFCSRRRGLKGARHPSNFLERRDSKWFRIVSRLILDARRESTRRNPTEPGRGVPRPRDPRNSKPSIRLGIDNGLRGTGNFVPRFRASLATFHCLTAERRFTLARSSRMLENLKGQLSSGPTIAWRVHPLGLYNVSRGK